MKRFLALMSSFLVGCSALGPPVSSEGIARVLREAAPALRELTQADSPQGETASAAAAPIKVIVLLPEFGRPWWQMPFSLSDVGSRKVYVIVVH